MPLSLTRNSRGRVAEESATRIEFAPQITAYFLLLYLEVVNYLAVLSYLAILSYPTRIYLEL